MSSKRSIEKKSSLLFLGLVVALILSHGCEKQKEPKKTEETQEEAAVAEPAGKNAVRAPLDIRAEVQSVASNPGGAQENGGLVNVLVSVKPLLDTKELSWHLDLPEGVMTRSGPGSWSGAAVKDRDASFTVTLAVPDGKLYYVDVIGEYESEDGVKVRNATSLKIDLGDPEPPVNPSTIREDESGRRVKTFKGNTQGGGQ